MSTEKKVVLVFHPDIDAHSIYVNDQLLTTDRRFLHNSREIQWLAESLGATVEEREEDIEPEEDEEE